MPLSVPQKCLLILLDGLADRAQPALGGQTPLQAAATPNLDALASRGSTGYFHASSPGEALPSEVAHFLMMGAPASSFPGRGYLEATGNGVEMAPGQVALLANLAICRARGDRLILQEKKPPLPKEVAGGLMETLARLPGARFWPAKGSGGVLVLPAPASPYITDSDPMLPGRPILRPAPLAEAPDPGLAERTAGSLADWLVAAHRALAAHPLNRERQNQGLPPVNAMLTQRAGAWREPFSLDKRWGLAVLSIASAPIYAGVFRALGAQASLVKQGPDPASDLAAKLELAIESLDRFDLVHVHSKDPDEAGHAKDPAAKREVIAALDRGLAQVARREDLLLVVTGDHATPCSGDAVHSGEPSPLLMAGPGVWRDPVRRFAEPFLGAGALGLLRGRELMGSILNYLDRAKLAGLRDHPEDLPYYPGPEVPALSFARGEQDA